MGKFRKIMGPFLVVSKILEVAQSRNIGIRTNGKKILFKNFYFHFPIQRIELGLFNLNKVLFNASF
ncbi:hypothetical protein DB44_EH00080 [Candidatus Protochlamydia amoebophila]|uniref:Uncharacterized protein n=1 Tax=Candidatus Protochlamydia amoebophila TaxID=362787 RepID=A0A0C1JKV9_9BACT|nr:hypothetical protein DB44_EH00080 [Candidatus Protochlamydia amoebophila]